MDYSSYIEPMLTAISIIASTIIAIVVCKRSIRGQEEKKIYDSISDMLRIAIEYPALEDDDFCKNWKQETDINKKNRYICYCCFVFNQMANLWRFYKGDISKIENTLHVYEIVRQHKEWWLSDQENQLGYDPKFVTYINDVIKNIRRR